MTLASSCRSKKVTRNRQEAERPEDKTEIADVPAARRAGNNLTPSVIMPGDTPKIKDMIRESNELKETLSRRMNSVIYGSPEALRRRAAENAEMRHKIDSIDAEIGKARNR